MVRTNSQQAAELVERQGGDPAFARRDVKADSGTPAFLVRGCLGSTYPGSTAWLRGSGMAWPITGQAMPSPNIHQGSETEGDTERGRNFARSAKKAASSYATARMVINQEITNRGDKK